MLNHTLSSYNDWVEFRLDEPAPAKPLTTEFSHNQQNLFARDATASWKNSIIENAVKIQSESVAFETQLVVSLPRSANPVWWLSRLRAVKCQLTDKSKRPETRFYLICKVGTVGSFYCGAREREYCLSAHASKILRALWTVIIGNNGKLQMQLFKVRGTTLNSCPVRSSLNWVNFDSA